MNKAKYNKLKNGSCLNLKKVIVKKQWMLTFLIN